MLQGLILVGTGVGFIGSRLLVRPLLAVARFLFRNVFVHLYQEYFTVRQWLAKVFAPAKNKLLYPLLHGSTIHLVIAVITIGVVANNLFIQETHAEEFGKNTILNSVLGGADDQVIVETAISGTRATPDYLRLTGTVAPAKDTQTGSGTIADAGQEESIVTSNSSAALLAPNIADTTVGSRPREAVTYYLVEGGDTISTIAEKFNVSTNTILWENRLGPRDYIKPGDKLTVLPTSGVSVQIKKGDTLASIAKKYQVDADTILNFNKLASTDAIESNQVLILPGGTMPEEPKPVQIRTSTSSFALLDFNVPPPSRATSGNRLLWPTPSRRINQYFTWRHTGVDIDGDYSSPIYAADDGRVEFASGNRSGYGLYIIINHGGGIKTLYGHESKLFVKVGDSVKKGQTIGMVGCTGRCTGTHVHFEVIANGRKVNPLSYL